jgi:hypothetical protein
MTRPYRTYWYGRMGFGWDYPRDYALANLP